jgi:tetratricopeptide (TPR) repeat protein
MIFSLTNKEHTKTELNRAIMAKNAGDLDSAREILNELVVAFGDSDGKVAAIIHGELGFLDWQSGDFEQSANHYRRAAALAPDSELISLGLFHSLTSQGRWEEALNEALRYVKTMNSTGYRKLLSFGFGDDLDPKLRAIAEEIRHALAGPPLP